MKVVVREGDPRELAHVDVNARYMTHEQFHRLKSNIAEDEALTSTPFVVVEPDGSRTILSGNHRVDGAIEAGLPSIFWLETEDELSPARRRAIQISHNAITGQDDPAVLAQLYSEIDDVNLKAYAGLDDAQLQQLAEVDFGSFKAAALEYQTLSLTFLPDDADKAMAAFAEARELAKSADQRWLARYQDHLRILQAIEVAGGAYDVRNFGAALAYVLDVFLAHREDLQVGWYDEATGTAKHGAWVPMVTALGQDEIPAAVAVLLAKVVRKMRDAKAIESGQNWQAIERLCQSYLAGDGR